MFPLRDNIRCAVPARHGRADRDQRDRLPARDPPRRQLLRRTRRACRPLRRDPLRVHPPRRHCELVRARRRLAAIACQARRRLAARPQPATWATAFTSMFLHASFLHIVGNMLFLAIFGPTVEDALGRVRFLVFYLLGGLVALARRLLEPGSTAPDARRLGRDRAPCSAATSCCTRAPASSPWSSHLLLHARRAARRLSARVLVRCSQLPLGARRPREPVGGGGVAYFAHIGGFAFGLLAIRLFVCAPPRAAVELTAH